MLDFLKSSFVQNTKKELLETVGEGELYGRRIIAGLSGGADSVALTLALFALSSELGFKLCACHVNHMIRGSEADRDEEFSRKLCSRYGIEFQAFKRDVPEIARNEKKGLEEAARDVRYEIFEAVKKSKDDLIATAHTASDNAETMLFNMIRGCGTGGLSGIPKRRGSIIRPIIFADRRDVEAFLSDIGEGYVTDSTNLLDDCTRNIIRHNIIPMLKVINPSFIKSASSLSTLSKLDNDFLDRCAKESFTDDITAISKLDYAVSSRIIGEMYRRESGSMLPFWHTQMLVSKISELVRRNCGEAKSYDLPGELCARIECGRLSIVKKEAKDLVFEEYDIEAKKGINPICGDEYIVVIENISNKACNTDKNPSVFEYNNNFYTLFMEVSLFSGIIGSIRLRSGKSGDKIRISGMSKDIKKMYSAKRIPVNERKALPRICDSKSGEIIALPYVGVCDSQHECTEERDLLLRLYKITSRSDFSDNG